MVLQVPSDAGQMVDRVDAHLAQRAFVADPRELQELRGVDRAAAQDHIARACDLRPPAMHVLDADGPRAVEHDAVHECARPDVEVRAAHHRRQVGARGR
jgi:hypothetical protein